jgi:hypothetical protein
MAKGNNQKTANGSALEFEAQLWTAADKIHGCMDASEFHTLAGLGDALLPKLLWGELRVPEAAAITTA